MLHLGIILQQNELFCSLCHDSATVGMIRLFVTTLTDGTQSLTQPFLFYFTSLHRGETLQLNL